MNTIRNQNLTTNAQKLRKNMTKEECHLWFDFLKKLPYTVNRQKVMGNYILDFYISKAKIVIELDGSQHYEYEHKRADSLRDEYLNGLGITVLRYTNDDIHKRFQGVCLDILRQIDKALDTSSVSLCEPPSPQGED